MNFTEQQIAEMIAKEKTKLHLELVIIGRAIKAMKDDNYARDIAIKLLRTKSLAKKYKD
jgi:hypothetical protein